MVIKNANLTVRRGEIVGIAGPDGRRAHRARPQHLRPALRQPASSGQLILDGKEITLKHGARRRSTPASPTSPRTARRSASTCSTTSSAPSRRPASSKLRKGLVVDEREEVVVAERYRKSMNIKTPSVERGRRASCPAATSRRSCSRKWMYTEPERADPRRADPRHRRRRQVRDLRDHPTGSPTAGPRRHRDLLRAARAARHLRPHLHPRRGRITGELARAERRPGDPDALHDHVQTHGPEVQRR